MFHKLSTKLFFERGLGHILKAQVDVSNAQAQVSSGKRIINPSDDPVGSVSVLNLKTQISTTEQYIKNAQSVDTTLLLQEEVMRTVTDILNQVRDRILQGANDTLTSADRQTLAVEVQHMKDQLLDLANTRIAGGDYLFAGSRTQNVPFTRDAAGNVAYNGDQLDRYYQVGPANQVKGADNGYDVFQAIPTGNGAFQVTEGLLNSGTGVVGQNGVINSAEYVAEDYTITLRDNGGQLVYNVVGSVSGQIVPPLPDDPLLDAPEYNPGASIEFSGVSVVISGTPNDNDTFVVTPSRDQSIFTTLDNVINALQLADSTAELDARFRNQLNGALQNIDQALDHTSNHNAGLGVRMNIVEDQIGINDGFIFQATASLSSIEDVDMAEAISRLTRHSTALQASQQSYVAIQELLLFRFIS